MDRPTRLGLKDGEPEQIKALLGLPAVLRAIEPDEKYAVGNLGRESRAVSESPGTLRFIPLPPAWDARSC